VSFWAGFFAGVAAVYVFSTGFAVALMWWLHRKPVDREELFTDWVDLSEYVTGEPFDLEQFNIGEPITVELDYDDTMAGEPPATYRYIPFTHTTNIGEHVRGGDG